MCWAPALAHTLIDTCIGNVKVSMYTMQSFATLPPSLFHPACPRVVECGLDHMVEGRVEAIRNRTDWTINNGMAFVREGHVYCKLLCEVA